jgi:hypothetical protein
MANFENFSNPYIPCSLNNLKRICKSIMHMPIHMSIFVLIYASIFFFGMRIFFMSRTLFCIWEQYSNSAQKNLFAIVPNISKGLPRREVIRRLQWGFTLLSFIIFDTPWCCDNAWLGTLNLLQNTYMKKHI